MLLRLQVESGKTELEIWRLTSAKDSGRLLIPSSLDCCLNKTVTQITIVRATHLDKDAQAETARKKFTSRAPQGGGVFPYTTDDKLQRPRETFEGSRGTLSPWLRIYR